MFNVFPLDLVSLLGYYVTHMPDIDIGLLREIDSIVMGEQTVDLHLGLVFGAERRRYDLVESSVGVWWLDLVLLI